MNTVIGELKLVILGSSCFCFPHFQEKFESKETVSWTYGILPEGTNAFWTKLSVYTEGKVHTVIQRVITYDKVTELESTVDKVSSKYKIQNLLKHHSDFCLCFLLKTFCSRVFIYMTSIEEEEKGV